MRCKIIFNPEIADSFEGWWYGWHFIYSDRDGNPNVFNLNSDADRLNLNANDARPLNRWNADNDFVFARSRKSHHFSPIHAFVIWESFDLQEHNIAVTLLVMARTMNNKGKKVFVGLSGGVDSAVSAALLQKAGFDVTGVFIKVWQPDWIECNWAEERRDAMRVAAHLGIPFITLDCEDEYKKGVIDYMIAEYEAGRTPNPDVMCNKTVKFGAFYDWAMEKGADFVATGHYARIAAGASYRLLAGNDRNKDQSYFIWTLKQEQLAHIIFPVGDVEKPQVRKLAAKFKLPNADKKDSQGLCFIGKIDLKEFLGHYLKSEKGNVLNENGEVIGTHPGALFFTIGERHGFSIAQKSSNEGAYFVVDKDVEQNTLTVSNRADDASKLLPSATREVRLQNVNWISGSAPSVDMENSSKAFPLQVRSRYRQELQNAKIVKFGITETILQFEKPQDTLTAGQSLVIYEGDNCLGGGIIE